MSKAKFKLGQKVYALHKLEIVAVIVVYIQRQYVSAFLDQAHCYKVYYRGTEASKWDGELSTTKRGLHALQVQKTREAMCELQEQFDNLTIWDLIKRRKKK